MSVGQQDQKEVMPSPLKLVRNKTPLREEALWQPDETATKCFNNNCKTKFTWSTRKHHCRRCGYIYCSNCTTHRGAGKMLDGVPKNYYIEFAKNVEDAVAMRICDYCWIDEGGPEQPAPVHQPRRSTIQQTPDRRQTTPNAQPSPQHHAEQDRRATQGGAAPLLHHHNNNNGNNHNNNNHLLAPVKENGLPPAQVPIIVDPAAPQAQQAQGPPAQPAAVEPAAAF